MILVIVTVTVIVLDSVVTVIAFLSSLRLESDALARAGAGGFCWLPRRRLPRHTRPFASRPTPRNVRGGRGSLASIIYR